MEDGAGGRGVMISVGVGLARARATSTERGEEQREMVGGDAGVRLGVTTASTVDTLWTNASVLLYSHCGDGALL